MVPLLLFLILLVLAWPVFAIFGGALLAIVCGNLHIIVPTVLISLVYIAFLAPIAKRNNIKLGGRYGEALDPTKPIGQDYGELALKAVEHSLNPPKTAGGDCIEDGEALDPLTSVEPSVKQASTPDGLGPAFKASILDRQQWKPVSPRSEPQTEPHQVKFKPWSVKRSIIVAVIVFFAFVPLTIMVLDAATGEPRVETAVATTAVAPPPDYSGSQSKWQVANSVDPMTDVAALRFTLPSDGALSIRLIVECVAGKANIGIYWNEYLAAEKAGSYIVKDVTFRLGSGTAQTKTWVSSEDQTATWAGHPTLELLAGLIRNTRVAAQVTPYNSSPLTVTFDTTGLQQLVETNAAACGYVNYPSVKPSAPTEPVTANGRFIVNQTLTGWVRWDGEEGSINGQGVWAYFKRSTPGTEILFAGCEIKTTVSVPCKVTFGAYKDQIVSFISAGPY